MSSGRHVVADISADPGESFGPWQPADDAALMDIGASASIACGCHAGTSCPADEPTAGNALL
ncbi:MAG TPA: LamB/YcsF family protein [Streptosporangiaceae bacterium]|nr:LamB/YcsF family protein [Streptosporangiaceae bacterium]